MMFFNSKPFKILLPFVAYLLFAGQWLYGYGLAWYANIPEETNYFDIYRDGRSIVFKTIDYQDLKNNAGLLFTSIFNF